MIVKYYFKKDQIINYLIKKNILRISRQNDNVEYCFNSKLKKSAFIEYEKREEEIRLKN